MTQYVAILLFSGIGFVLLLSIGTLVIAASIRREARRISESLERHGGLERELALAREHLSKAQQHIKQLEEESPEKLKWELARVREELDRLLRTYWASQQEAEQQRQEGKHRLEQQNQQRLRLEQECQNLMEELGRWRERYLDARLEVEQSEQQRSDAEQKVEQLTQMRDRLLQQIRQITTE
jgi:chromosome segregation ATPase